MAEQQKKLMISRAAMKSIRAMNREQLSEYITNVYVEGFKAGRKKSTPDDIMKAFREVLISVDSIGPARADAIMKRFSDFFGVDAAGTPAETESEKQNADEDPQEGAGNDGEETGSTD